MEYRPPHLAILHGGKPAKYSRFEKVTNDTSSTVYVDDLTFFFESWYDECHMRGVSPRTLELRRMLAGRLMWYLQHHNHTECGIVEMRAFFRHLRDGHNLPGGRWNIPDIAKYRTQHAKSFQPLRPATILTYYRHLAAFFQHLISEGYLEDTPFRRIKPPICRPDQIDPFDDDEVRAIFTAAQNTSSGIRVIDVDFNNKRVSVTGKGNKRRTVFFGSKCAKALWKYLYHRKHHGTVNDEDYLFVSVGRNKGQHLSKDALQSLMKRVVKVAGIKRTHAGVHTFRHTFAIEFLRGNSDVRALQEILGHTNINTTMIYVNYVDRDMQNQYKKSNPGDRI